MRRQGNYPPQSIPSFASLVQASTDAREAAMRPLIARVEAASRAHDQLLPDVHSMRPIQLGKDDKAALIDGYDGRTVEMNRLLSSMLDTLPPENADLCPYCSLEQNPDLDHFLPKARFPEFSLHGRNLIPICTPCNRRKSNSIVFAGARLFLNAAFEPSIDVPIIEASIAFPQHQLSVTYTLNDRGRLPQPEREVAETHFRRLQLASRYRKRAIGALAALKKNLSQQTRAVRRKLVRDYLSAASLGEPTNSWKPALADAIRSDMNAMMDWLGRPSR